MLLKMLYLNAFNTFTANTSTVVGTYILGAVSGEYIPVTSKQVVGNTITILVSGVGSTTAC